LYFVWELAKQIKYLRNALQIFKRLEQTRNVSSNCVVSGGGVMWSSWDIISVTYGYTHDIVSPLLWVDQVFPDGDHPIPRRSDDHSPCVAKHRNVFFFVHLFFLTYCRLSQFTNCEPFRTFVALPGQEQACRNGSTRTIGTHVHEPSGTRTQGLSVRTVQVCSHLTLGHHSYLPYFKRFIYISYSFSLR